jgi:hypothetical protein
MKKLQNIYSIFNIMKKIAGKMINRMDRSNMNIYFYVLFLLKIDYFIKTIC